MFCSFFDRDTCWWLPPAIRACVREVGIGLGVFPSSSTEAPSGWCSLSSHQGTMVQLDSGLPRVVMCGFLFLVSLWIKTEQRQSSHLSKIVSEPCWIRSALAKSSPSRIVLQHLSCHLPPSGYRWSLELSSLGISDEILYW